MVEWWAEQHGKTSLALQVTIDLFDAIKCTGLNEEHDIAIIPFLDDAFPSRDLLLQKGTQNHLQRPNMLVMLVPAS